MYVHLLIFAKRKIIKINQKYMQTATYPGNTGDNRKEDN